MNIYCQYSIAKIQSEICVEQSNLFSFDSTRMYTSSIYLFLLFTIASVTYCEKYDDNEEFAGQENNFVVGLEFEHIDLEYQQFHHLFEHLYVDTHMQLKLMEIVKRLKFSKNSNKFYDYEHELVLGFFKTPMNKYYNLLMIKTVLDLARLGKTMFRRQLHYLLEELEPPHVDGVESCTVIMNLHSKVIPKLGARIGHFLYQYISSRNVCICYDMKLYNNSYKLLYDPSSSKNIVMEHLFEPFMKIKMKKKPKYGFLTEDYSSFNIVKDDNMDIEAKAVYFGLNIDDLDNQIIVICSHGSASFDIRLAVYVLTAYCGIHFFYVGDADLNGYSAMVNINQLHDYQKFCRKL